MNLFISPHNDDEALFGAFTLIREKPLVVIVTDSYIQEKRGEGITAGQRIQESVNALKILGCPSFFIGIPDITLAQSLTELGVVLSRFKGFEKVYAPAMIENGNEQHNLIGMIAKSTFPNLIPYMTYSKTDLWKNGSREVVPTLEELQLKNKALNCYVSQLNLGATRPHFEAVYGRSEWYE